jgi:alpha-glucosidase
MANPWWKSAVFYQIYVRSFADSNSDGIGDLDGVRRRLDHLQWLGVDALLLSPFYPSPLYDFGYDITNHCDVDPLLGSLNDFDRLLDNVHQRGMKLLVDWVPNHTSVQHPWFVASRRSHADPRRNWYVWRDPGPEGRPPNEWVSAFAGRLTWERDPGLGDLRVTRLPTQRSGLGSAWTRDPLTGQYYLHFFLPEQPDINWREPSVAQKMLDVLQFWLDRGVDGFRADAIHAVGKDPLLRTNEDDVSGFPRAWTNDQPETHKVVREVRALVDAYPGERVVVGEVYLPTTAQVAAYYGHGEELHLAFNFAPLYTEPLYTEWRAASWARRLEEVDRELNGVGAWPTWVLSNHDNPRHRTRYGNEARARAAAVLLLTVRGSPFLYAGEELGLQDAVVSPDKAVDLGGRDGCRAPYPWESDPPHGWTHEPWLPWPPEPCRINAQALREDPSSILHLYRRLIRARRSSLALRYGDMQIRNSPEGILSWVRFCEGDERLIIMNFTSEVRCPFPDEEEAHGWEVEVSSEAAKERLWDGRIGPEEAIVLRPVVSIH